MSKDDKKVIVGVVICIIVIFNLGILVTWLSMRNPEPLPMAQKPEYGIWQYDYGRTAVYKYTDYNMVYEYSYSGMHLVQIIKGTAQITVVTFDNKDEALEFMYLYLEDIKREARL